MGALFCCVAESKVAYYGLQRKRKLYTTENCLYILINYDQSLSRMEKKIVISVYFEICVNTFLCLRCPPLFPCFPPIDSIITLITVWRITGNIIRTTILVNYICMLIMEF